MIEPYEDALRGDPELFSARDASDNRLRAYVVSAVLLLASVGLGAWWVAQ